MFMGDSYTNNQTGGGDFQNQRQNGRNNFRGGRGPNNREGGFRTVSYTHLTLPTSDLV